MLNKELDNKYSIKNKIYNLGFRESTLRGIKTTQKESLNPTVLNHLAIVEAKLGYRFKIVKRDPTRDKRLIEFLYSLPYDSFVIDGTERGLIRKAMDGIVPEDLLVDTRVRGQQSADWLQRLGPKWQSLRQELMSICNTQDEIMK